MVVAESIYINSQRKKNIQNEKGKLLLLLSLFLKTFMCSGCFPLHRQEYEKEKRKD